MLRTSLIAIALAAMVMLGGSVPIGAQSTLDADPGSSIRTRAELEALLADYEQALRSPAYSEATKASIRARAERVSARLAEGDFRLGDRVVLSVQGEPTLPDTVPVQAGPRITLPLFGDISLAGVLRSEISEHLTQELSRFIRDPVVNARGLMRVSVQGAVNAPGFYVVPAEMLLSETMMVAGGPASNANMGELRIERGSMVVFQGQDLQEAVRQGFTLDQLNLQAGDQVVVPERPAGGTLARVGVIAGVLSTLTILILRLSG